MKIWMCVNKAWTGERKTWGWGRKGSKMPGGKDGGRKTV